MGQVFDGGRLDPDFTAGSRDTSLAYTRFWVLKQLLMRARNGSLNVDWRETLPGEWFAEQPARDQAHWDTTTLVLREMIERPRADWEPHMARGDWERALDAWYRESLALCDYYEVLEAWHRHVAIDEQRLRMRPRLEDVLARMLSDQPVNWYYYSEFARQTFGRTETFLREMPDPTPGSQYGERLMRIAIGAYYRAALAAAGRQIDWRTWYCEQLVKVDPEATQTLRASIQREQSAAWVTRLPDYWTTPASVTSGAIPPGLS